LGAKIVDNLQDLISQVDTVMICIKPQDFSGFLGQLAPFVQGKQVISLAAGVTTASIQKALNLHNVVRFMPNLAARTGTCLTGVAAGAGASEEFITEALEISSAGGSGTLVPERLMAAVTGISGSGLAFVFEFIHALSMGGVREGLPYPQALDFALATTEGAVQLLRQTKEHPAAMVSKVTSPAGTTIEGIQALEDRNFAAAVMASVSAASRRAQELEA